jgi:hypothetical protein
MTDFLIWWLLVSFAALLMYVGIYACLLVLRSLTGSTAFDRHIDALRDGFRKILRP